MSAPRFHSLLVANRGEIARRIFRTARAMGLRTVAVFVDADADAPFVGEADDAVRLESYLDGAAIVRAALAAGAGAVHPGYGFLAENAGFAQSVIDAELVWVGPPTAAISAMGDKIEAKRRAVDAGVPVLPSSEDPDDFASVGFPLLVKAAAGGGGKGMRVVHDAAHLDDAVAAARREALSGFGDDRVFAERYVPRARHIEIQILGDAHGNLIHLGERECSIQRRHQKIIEESPSPFVTAATRTAMGDAALRLAGALDYESAGTVEFLVDDETGAFFFLEVNTRLQVEHPVTEQVTGIDLVREQLRIAQLEPLGYTQDDVAWHGHAIEARLYAEDPANDFLPAVGTVEVFEPAPEPTVRWDTGVATGSEITVDFDPMIAKVIASAPTRAEAAGRLALALERLHVGGTVTNRDFLAAVLRTPAFLAGDTTTDFIERLDPPRDRVLDGDEQDWLLVAAAMWLQGRNRTDATTLAALPSAFRVGRLAPERVQLRLGDTEQVVHYRANRDNSFRIGDTELRGDAIVHRWSADLLDLEYQDRRRTLRVTQEGPNIHLTGGSGGVSFAVVPRFSVPEAEIPGGAVAAPMPGRVIELRVAAGDTVEAGQVVVVLEAMKMENHLRAAEAGIVIEVLAAVGDQVEKDALLMVIDDGSERDDD
ncbi:MAG: acetyl/propionyl-CoA carboxylase subuit alpha [Acidimicrobiales bacterium]|nr:MAG: acetyl/propionyl-CoA carboxylase subuit alpha [Acidimicrobiales bacterium]